LSIINLYNIDGQEITQLVSSSVELERTLQSLIEKHLETLLGVKFLATEYQITGNFSGRIDTLGLDAENNCPVIIEYKRTLNQNVMSQGLSYLGWLLDHKANFEALCREKLGEDAPHEVDWSSPRVLCIASDFTRYDENALQQIGQNIELIKYRKFGEDFLLFELVNQVSSSITTTRRISHTTVSGHLESADSDLKELFKDFESHILSLGDDVQKKTLKHYFAFRRLRNFACVEIHPRNRQILVYVKLNPDDIDLEEGFTRDVRNIGHYGTGDLEIAINTRKDFEKAKPLLLKSYEST